MQSIKSNEIVKKINNLRKKNINNFQSNYFFTQIEEDILYAENNDALIFLSREKTFYKLFYAFVDAVSFSNLLKDLPDINIYLEIISKQEPSHDLQTALKPYFEYKTTYQKLYKKLDVIEKKIPVISTVDIDLIFEKLYQSFDIYFEHLMQKEELIELASNNKVITIYENNEMTSFIIYKVQGTKAYLNQIANYGSKSNLIDLWKKFYLALNNDGIKYLDLWYNKQNKKAENMYNIEQFQPLNMFNYCYKKV